MLTLYEAQAHLRIDHNDEDELLQAYIDAAEQSVADYLGIELPAAMPAPVRAAILLRVADLYENREAVTDRSLYDNPTFARLLAPYRSLSV